MTIGRIRKKRTSKEQDPSQKSAISELRNTISLNKYRSHIHRTSTRCHNINKTGMIYFQILIKKNLVSVNLKYIPCLFVAHHFSPTDGTRNIEKMDLIQIIILSADIKG